MSQVVTRPEVTTKMKTPEHTTVFAGLDGRTDAQLPDWYTRQKQRQDRLPDDGPVSFAEAIRTLPRATDTTVAYRNPYTREWVETDRFNAIVEPSRLRDQTQPRGQSEDRDDEPTDPLFHVPSDSYTILNPVDVYGPLEDVLREQEVDGRPFSEVVFGEVRQYRSGGEVHMDVMFDGLEVSLPGRNSDPITMGVTSGYDFFGGHAVYVEGFAQDGICSNTMRSLTDKEILKHIGDVKDFRAWWERILAQVELVADDLFDFIQDAQEIDLDFTDLPFGVAAFYELLGFPSYLAERAAEDAEANASNPFVIDMWTLHSGATYALTHFFRGKEGASLDEYVRIANDVLFNPEGTVERVQQAYEQQLEAEDSEGTQAALAGEQAVARIERVGKDLRERAEQFESREEALRARLQRVSES